MPRGGSMTYNPATGEWTPSGGGSGSTPSTSAPSSGGSSTSGNSNLTSSNPSKNTSTGAVEKKYNTIEINTLQGSLNFIVTEETIKLKAGDTVKLNGLGKFLSGNYYVKEVTRQVSSSGYSHSATVIRTDYGKTLKLNTTTTEKTSTPPTPAEPVASNDTPQRTYTVKKGDCLWNIAKQFYGNGAAYTKIYDANTKQIADPHWIYPGQVFVIP